MSNKSWRLQRRTFLQGTGAAIALPLLEGMIQETESVVDRDLPRRMCCFYFPFGVATKDEWNWFPTGEGKDFKLSKTLAALEPFRDEITVMQGLYHDDVRSVPGHDSGDSFLTAVPVKAPNFRNGISLDQFAAQHVGAKTRFGSLVFSSDGGVGEPTRTRTISYDKEGRPVPAMSEPERIFQRLFGEPTAAQRLRMERDASILDRVADHSRSLQLKLGRHDQRKLDEYLQSVRSVEKNIQSSQKWALAEKPKVDRQSLQLNVALEHDPDNFLKTMFDLVFLALQTDTTRIATYQICQNLTSSLTCNRLPKAIGLYNWHGMGHGQNKDPQDLGRMQEYITQNLSRFLQKLRDAEEADRNMLDRTIVLHGSTNTATHGTDNYPLVLAGGRRLGFSQGQYLDFHSRPRQPCANLFVSMLHGIGIESHTFADSTGPMSELLG